MAKNLVSKISANSLGRRVPFFCSNGQLFHCHTKEYQTRNSALSLFRHKPNNTKYTLVRFTEWKMMELAVSHKAGQINIENYHSLHTSILKSPVGYIFTRDFPVTFLVPITTPISYFFLLFFSCPCNRELLCFPHVKLLNSMMVAWNR